ncbi:STOREKEEPER protein-like, partial [Magnolia sinica]|uniref:STOREKEEPER protein-like n=1 Tax=Magnolia sinica TaxID=86752 RepID=UPI0026585FFA
FSNNLPSKRISQRQSRQQQEESESLSTSTSATAKANDTAHNSSQPIYKNPNPESLPSSSNTNSPLNPNSNSDNHNEEESAAVAAEEEGSAYQRLNNVPDIQQPQQEPAVVVDSNSARSNKRQKPSPDGEDLTPKKPNFERIWSDEDEIGILEGMIEYMKMGSNPSSDWSAFHEFIKRSLHCYFTRIQVGDKIRRLRRKYLRNAKKSKNGDGPHLLDSHEEIVYSLSKKIWGGKPSTGESGFQSSQEAKEVTVAVGPPRPPKVVATAVNSAAVGVVENGGLYPDLNELLNFGRNLNAADCCESLLKGGLDLIEKSKAEELSEKWKKLLMMKMEVHLNQVALYQELGMLAMEAMKSSS